MTVQGMVLTILGMVDDHPGFDHLGDDCDHAMDAGGMVGGCPGVGSLTMMGIIGGPPWYCGWPSWGWWITDW